MRCFAHARVMIIAALASTLCACALFSNPVFIAGLQDAIDIAIGIICAKNGGVALCTKIATAATTLSGVANNSTSTLAELATQADNLIAKQGFDNDVTTGLDSLILLAVAGAQSGLSGVGTANPTAVANLTVFFTDIANAAQNYGKATAAAARKGLKVYVPPVRPDLITAR